MKEKTPEQTRATIKAAQYKAALYEARCNQISRLLHGIIHNLDNMQAEATIKASINRTLKEARTFIEILHPIGPPPAPDTAASRAFLEALNEENLTSPDC